MQDMLAGLEDIFPMLRNRDPSTIQIDVACPMAGTGKASDALTQYWAPVRDDIWEDIVVKSKPTHFAVSVTLGPKEQCRRELVWSS